MSNLLASLRTSTSALDALTEAVTITQNNVMNAGSAGYARQKVTLSAREFDPSTGAGGGVRNGELQSARDQYAERAVRAQNSRASGSATTEKSLKKLEMVFPISSGDSIPARLDRLYASFSAWGVAPDDLASKENVVAAASNVVDAFQETARKLSEVSQDTENAIRASVDHINRLASRISAYNKQVRSGALNDAGVDAGVHATLDELSSEAEVDVIRQQDGTYTLLFAGQQPLVVGDTAYQLSVGSPVVQAHEGGALGALLAFRNGALADQRTDLDRLAAKVADRMSELFAGTTAPSLTLQAGLQAANLDASTPGSANGKALELAGLANPVNAADKLDGRSFTEFYGDVSSRVGGLLNNAKFDNQAQAQLSAQVQAFRDQISGVSMDEEALHLVQFQKAYQASARMIAAIDELLDIAVNLGRR